MSTSSRARQSDCHPERKHYARGLCRICYYADKLRNSKNKAYRDSQPGLERVTVPGWGVRV